MTDTEAGLNDEGQADGMPKGWTMRRERRYHYIGEDVLGKWGFTDHLRLEHFILLEEDYLRRDLTDDELRRLDNELDDYIRRHNESATTVSAAASAMAGLGAVCPVVPPWLCYGVSWFLAGGLAVFLLSPWLS